MEEKEKEEKKRRKERRRGEEEIQVWNTCLELILVSLELV